MPIDRRHHRAFAFFVLVSAAAWAPPATASDAAGLAEQRYDEGRAALDRGDFEAARLAFVQANALDPQPRYLLGMAAAEEKAGHPLEALAHARQSLKSPKLADDDRKSAEGLVTEASGRVAHVRVEAPPSTAVTVDGAPPGSEASPGDPIDLAPGRHALEAHFGARTASTIVSPAAGETIVWQLQFEPAPPAAPSTADGTNGPTYDTPTGKPRAGARWVAATGFLVGGLVVVGIMGGFLAAAGNENSKWASLDATTGACPQPPSSASCIALKNAADARASDQNIAIGLGVTAGVLAVGAVVAFLAWPEAPKSRTGALIPIIGKDAVGAQWVTSF
jgi:tetratricopeptide (TPR) repeat protein